jgi:peroxiredoxin
VTTSTRPDGALNRELRAIVEGAGLPVEVAQTIARGNAQIEQSGEACGLAVGDIAPEFTLFGADGHQVRLSERLAEGPVIVSFYRGAWCPFCNLELRALASALPKIRELGASLIAISPQAPDESAGLVQQHHLTFDVLSDLDGAVARAWKLRFTLSDELKALYQNVFELDLTKANADGSWTLPVPGTFVLDRHGVIRARYVSSDYTTRMEPDEIISTLTALARDDGRNS